jgi:hypothetical protein
VQTNPTQNIGLHQNYASLMIDDSALGCPLTYNPKIHPRPFVNWSEVEKILIKEQNN